MQLGVISGTQLHKDWLPNGPGYLLSSGRPSATWVSPGRVIPGVARAGGLLEIFYTGGEAISELGIHLLQFDMVLIADEFFTGLPNMHTIRGSKPRIPDNYLWALNRVLELRPQWLLGSHIMPMEGREHIYETVQRYRDATR